MDDNPLEEDSSKPILNETLPEVTPSGAEAFSMASQRDKFLGGSETAKSKETKPTEDALKARLRNVLPKLPDKAIGFHGTTFQRAKIIETEGLTKDDSSAFVLDPRKATADQVYSSLKTSAKYAVRRSGINYVKIRNAGNNLASFLESAESTPAIIFGKPEENGLQERLSGDKLPFGISNMAPEGIEDTISLQSSDLENAGIPANIDSIRIKELEEAMKQALLAKAVGYLENRAQISQSA